MNDTVTDKKILNHIYVSNIPLSYEEHELTKLFEKYGKVISCIVREDHAKRHGMVTMESESAAHKAVANLNSTIIHGKTIFMQATSSSKLPTYENRKTVTM